MKKEAQEALIYVLGLYLKSRKGLLVLQEFENGFLAHYKCCLGV
jgi:hypothetical protein